jgi:hypothetical protein
VGAAEPRPAHRSENVILAEFLQGLDLLYDATAEIGVQQYLSHVADNLNLPQVYVTATEGAWGGIVARCIPARTGCWFCLKLWQDARELPLPSFRPSDEIQPRGCATRTFTGTSFDLSPIVSQGVRLAIQTLSESHENVPPYPRTSFDVSVLNLRDQEGNVDGYPRWDHYKLNIHPECRYCATRVRVPSGSTAAA